MHISNSVLISFIADY